MTNPATPDIAAGTRVVLTDRYEKTNPNVPVGTRGTVLHRGDYGVLSVRFDGSTRAYYHLGFERFDLVDEEAPMPEGTFKVGQRVRHLTVGATGTVVSNTLAQGQVPVEWDDDGEIAGAFPQNLTTVVDESPSAPPRPRIDFSASRYATARAYASAHASRVNRPETNEALRTVAAGGEVDAYALARACADAMRHVATRFGQSTARRRAGEQVAHLAHIAHAVIENHADGLPGYEPGERSRVVVEVKAKLSEAQREIAALKEAGESARQELDRATEALNDEVRAGSIARQAVARLEAEVERLSATLDAATEDLVRHVALREFVEEHLLDEEGRATAAGFTHGWASATRD